VDVARVIGLKDNIGHPIHLYFSIERYRILNKSEVSYMEKKETKEKVKKPKTEETSCSCSCCS